MNTPDTGGAAFPRPASMDSTSGTLPDWYQMEKAQEGMTLRDWFAGRAMDRLLTTDTVSPFFKFAYPPGHELHFEKMIGHGARIAYMVADAMLAARKGGAS